MIKERREDLVQRAKVLGEKLIDIFEETYANECELGDLETDEIDFVISETNRILGHHFIFRHRKSNLRRK